MRGTVLRGPDPRTGQSSVEKVGPAGDVYLDAPNVAPPPGNPRFPLFDSLRAIAALCVFLFHVLVQTNTLTTHPSSRWAIELATQGVAIFFLISGFLLYRPFLVARRGGRRLKVRDYARRRLLRIVPAYWAALTVVVFVMNRPNGVTTHNFWVFYGFGQIYQWKTINDGIAAAWTLCVEVTFYAALPLFAYAGARLARDRRSVRGDVALLIVLAAASIAFHAYVYGRDSFWWAGTLPGSFYWFALGMGLAIASVLHEERSAVWRLLRPVIERPTLFWIAAVGLFVVVYEWVPHPGEIGTGGNGEYLLYGVVALLVLLPAVFGDDRGGLARRVLRMRGLAWLGLVSYGFYLYHDDLAVLISRHAAGTSHPFLVTLIAAFVVTSLVAGASFYLLERPILRLKEVRLTARLRSLRARRAGDA